VLPTHLLFVYGLPGLSLCSGLLGVSFLPFAFQLKILEPFFNLIGWPLLNLMGRFLEVFA
jgi:hypothetical protein